MEHIYNVSAIKGRMGDVPKAQRLHDYFKGTKDAITLDQKKELLSIINKESSEFYLNLLEDIELDELKRKLIKNA